MAEWWGEAGTPAEDPGLCLGRAQEPGGDSQQGRGESLEGRGDAGGWEAGVRV